MEIVGVDKYCLFALGEIFFTNSFIKCPQEDKINDKPIENEIAWHLQVRERPYGSRDRSCKVLRFLSWLYRDNGKNRKVPDRFLRFLHT